MPLFAIFILLNCILGIGSVLFSFLLTHTELTKNNQQQQIFETPKICTSCQIAYQLHTLRRFPSPPPNLSRRTRKLFQCWRLLRLRPTKPSPRCRFPITHSATNQRRILLRSTGMDVRDWTFEWGVFIDVCIAASSATLSGDCSDSGVYLRFFIHERFGHWDDDASFVG